MRVLDLFSGLGGWSKPFIEAGDYVVTLDIEAKFKPTLVADILDDQTLDRIKALGPFDVITASPPCEGFSVAAIGKNWRMHDFMGILLPKSSSAERGLVILRRTLVIIRDLRPTYWVLENPRGAMRRMPELGNIEHRTVTYCQYGEKRMKPTDLWGCFPDSFVTKPACNNGDPCHDRAPRGSRLGTQGIRTAALRSLIPYQLARDLSDACRKEGHEQKAVLQDEGKQYRGLPLFELR